MSENLNRSTPDFSKYDSMSIEELEEILRTDAQGPERDDSDVDEILYVMEVLAKKRRQDGIAGKTALEAYQEFQQHYLPMDKEESAPKRKTKIIPFRRIAAVAASLVLVFSLSITANAFSFKDVWNAVVTWAQETFSFSMGVVASEPNRVDELAYSSLEDALIDNQIDSKIVPKWFPDGYTMIDFIVDRNPRQESYIAIYDNGNDTIKVSVHSYLIDQPEQIEMSEGYSKKYSTFGIDFYLFSNLDINRAVWLVDTYECCISGHLTETELQLMIDSIWED